MSLSDLRADMTIRLSTCLVFPGLLMQRMTTKEPDDEMIEVGIASVEAVFDWKKWQEENNVCAH